MTCDRTYAQRTASVDAEGIPRRPLVPPAIEASITSPTSRVDAFLAAGHVCSIMGTWQYPPLVEAGNVPAQQMLADVFEVCDRRWRGIGEIPASGWRLGDRYRDFDAESRFDVGAVDSPESKLCRSGEVLQGKIKPNECAAFGKECTPRHPLGATMVSSEGACAAYYQYRRLDGPGPVPEELGVG